MWNYNDKYGRTSYKDWFPFNLNVSYIKKSFTFRNSRIAMSQCLRNIGNKSELTKKEAGQTDEIFLSPRNKSFQNSNSNRRTCFFFSLFLASPIWDLENFPTFLYSLKKKQIKRTKFFCPRLEKWETDYKRSRFYYWDTTEIRAGRVTLSYYWDKG